jgi:hypothetical protein
MWSSELLRPLRRILENVLPTPMLRWLVFVFGNLLLPKLSYSAFGEDLIAYQHLKSLNHKGFYLDIGCFHPRWASNTLLFHKKGWRGVAVDLDRYKLSYFKRSRGDRVTVLEAAVTGKKMPTEYTTAYKFRGKTGYSDLDTVDEKTAKAYRDCGMGEFICEKVRSIAINDLLEGLPTVNFLCIDAEGTDLDIVRNINFKRYQVDFILFEDNDSHGQGVDDLLRQNGYKHVLTAGGSVAYALKKHSLEGS